MDTAPLLNNFSDLVVGTELYKAVRLSDGELANPHTAERMHELAEFLNKHPDPLFVISRSKNNKNPSMSNLEFLLGYTRLQKEKMALNSKIGALDKEISFYE